MIKYLDTDGLKYFWNKIKNNITENNSNNIFDGFSGLIGKVELNDNNIIADEVSFQSIFVSNNGDDINGNGSIDKPYKSINKALEIVKEGQTIYIREGVYKENLILNKSGNENKYITIRNFPNESVKLDCSGKNVEAIINFNQQSFIKIIGLELCNLTENNKTVQAILFLGGEKNCIIAKCDIHNINAKSANKGNAHGIKLSGLNNIATKNILIQQNHIHDCICGTSEALSVVSNNENVDIIQNIIHDNGNIGIDIIGNFKENSNPELDFSRNIYVSENEVYNCHSNNADCAGLYIDGASNVIISRNKSYNNQIGLEIGAEEVVNINDYYPHNNLAINNLIYNNTVRAVGLGGYSSDAGRTYNTYLWNNTIIHPSNAADVALSINAGENFSIINNIIIDLGTWNFFISGDVDDNDLKNYIFYNNLLYQFNGEEIGKYINIAGIQYNTSEFQNASFTKDNIITSNYKLNDDYTLAETSPAIGAGYYVPKILEFLDFSGKKRIANKIDIGCYKY